MKCELWQVLSCELWNMKYEICEWWIESLSCQCVVNRVAQLSMCCESSRSVVNMLWHDVLVRMWKEKKRNHGSISGPRWVFWPEKDEIRPTTWFMPERRGNELLRASCILLCVCVTRFPYLYINENLRCGLTVLCVLHAFQNLTGLLAHSFQFVFLSRGSRTQVKMCFARIGLYSFVFFWSCGTYYIVHVRWIMDIIRVLWCVSWKIWIVS